jgi:hypothetical protein
MGVTQLVRNELNARRFWCDWQLCNKACPMLLDGIESLADRILQSFNRKFDLQGHYRLHTKERLYCYMTERKFYELNSSPRTNAVCGKLHLRANSPLNKAAKSGWGMGD